jgi:glucose-6-phosphate 1-dehydrogenase
MERPAKNHPQQVRDEKVKVLRHIPRLTLDDLVVGQYTAGTSGKTPHAGYRDEQGIPETSVTPTYAAAVLRIDNERWKGVPFVLTAGKALDRRVSQVRIRFRELPENLFCDGTGCLPANELLIRIQPDEAIHLRIVNKEPGLGVRLAESDLNLKYQAAFSTLIPDAYECLLLDVLAGDKSLFIRSDELEAAWDVFTPVLHEMEDRGVRPEPYAFGSTGPDAVRELLARYGG